MKKFFAGVLAAAVFLSPAAHCGINTAYAVTKVADSQTAVDKSLEKFKALFEKEEITNDYTRDDLENLLFGACDYTVDGFVGCGFSVESFKLVDATASEAGYLKATVIIDMNEAMEGAEVQKAIPPLGGTDPSEDGDSTTAGDAKTDTKTDTKAETVNISESDAKKELAAAKSAINSAMFDFEVSNDTTLKDIIAMAKKVIPSGSHVTVVDRECSFNIVKASTTVNGTVSATIQLVCGEFEDRCPAAKTIEPVVTETSKLIDEDRSLVGKAIDSILVTNRTTKEELLAAGQKAVKNGTKLSWKSFVMIKATYEEDGHYTGYLTFELGDETRETRFDDSIKMLERDMPTGKISLNKQEWEILRITNVERHKAKETLLTMTPALQDACDIREPEIAQVFSHTRPNGQNPFTTITDLKYIKGGENIYKCDANSHDVIPAKVMNGWMNSPGHRANILTEDFDYMGVGAYEDKSAGTALQLFAGVSYPITSVVTASGKTDYIDMDALQKDYLICSTSDGRMSYMPLDDDYLIEQDGAYTVNIRSTQPIMLTIGGKGATTTVKTDDKIGAKLDPAAASQLTGVNFGDVHSSDYFAAAVKWAVDKNITTGTTATTFSPSETCTRAQILTFLWRAVGSPSVDAANPFTDVSASDYYYGAALWASQKGMVTGSKFAADTPCTRASTVTYMWQNAGSPKTAVSGKFGDVSATADCAQAVAWAIENGVTSGTSDTTFSPTDICDRGQIVTFLNRALAD